MIRASCPNCGHEFDAPIGRRGLGASYMAGAEKLSRRNVDILRAWLTLRHDSDYRAELHKDKLRPMLERYMEPISTSAFGGRLSELAAVGLVEMRGQGFYSINDAPAETVLEKDGVLREPAAVPAGTAPQILAQRETAYGNAGRQVKLFGGRWN